MAMIGSFLATKTIWNGNGLVADSFLLSQKADGIGVGVIMNIHSQVDHGQKPLATYHTNNDMANDKISSGWAVLKPDIQIRICLAFVPSWTWRQHRQL